MTWDSVQQAVRIALQFLAGFIVSKGILDEANATIVVGALTSLFGVAWWVIWDRHRKA